MRKFIVFTILLVSFYICLFGKCDAQGGMMPGPGTIHSVSSGAVFVQQKVVTFGGSNASGLFPSAATAGNSVIALISHTSVETTTSVQFTGGAPCGGTSLTQAGSTASVAGVKTEIWYKNNIPAGCTGLDVDTDLETRINWNGSEWSGLKNAVPEGNNTNTAVANSTVTTNSVTPASTNNLIIAIGGWTANDYSTGPINSFVRMTQTGGGSVFQEGAYKIQAAASAGSTGWGLTAGVNWAASIAAFGAN